MLIKLLHEKLLIIIFYREYNGSELIVIAYEFKGVVMKKIIFDLDGTLFQTDITLLKAVTETLMEYQIRNIDAGGSNSSIGKTTDDFLKDIFPSYESLTGFKQRLRYHEQKAVKECGMLFPGVKNMLEELVKLGYSLYLCSNGSDEYIELVLQSTGIRHYFSRILSTKFDISKGEAIKRFVMKGDFAIIVGDTVIDFDGAREAGYPSIAATFGYGGEEDCRKATFSAATAEEVVDRIILAEMFYTIADKLFLRNRDKVVGINGVDTSGKTMFTEQFSRYLTAIGIRNEVLHLDDFHNPSQLRCQGANEIDAYYENAFNYKQIIDEVLAPLKQEGKLDKTVCCMNLDTDKYENYRYYSIDENTVLLTEGVLLFREPLLSYLDGKVFLSIDFDEVLKRARERDVPKYGEEFLQKYVRKYIPIQEKYIKECEPMEISDIVIDNRDYMRPKLLGKRG